MNINLSFRRGFSLVEMLVVIVIVSIMMMIAFPRFASVMDAYNLRSARQTVTAYLVSARANAIATGRVASFVRSGNVISVVTDNGSGPVVVSAPQNLAAVYGVTLAAARDTLSFDPRGRAIGGNATTAYSLTKSSLLDSVCVVGLGKVVAKTCAF